MLKLSGKILQVTGWVIAHLQELALGAAVLLFCAWAWHWYDKAPQAPVGVPIEAVKADPVDGVKTEEYVPKVPLKVYPKRVEKKLHLPPSIQNDPEKRVLDSVDTASDGHEHRVTTYVDGTTGEVKTLDEALPKCWLCFTSKGDVGAYVGMDSHGDQRGMVQLRQGIVNVKDVTIGAMLTGTQSFGGSAPVNNDASAMVGVWYGWGR